MSKRKDLYWAIWKSHTRRFDSLLWELGRIHGIREAANMAGCLRVKPFDDWSGIDRQMRATTRDLQLYARKLKRRLVQESER